MSRIDELKEIGFFIGSDKGVKVSDLFLKDENGETYFEYIVKEGKFISDEILTDYISSNYDLLKYLIKNGRPLISYSNPDLLFIEEPLIIDLFENGQNFDDIEIINKIFKYPNIVQKMINIDFDKLCGLINKVNDSETLYNCFKSINRLDLIQYANEYTLLNKTSNGISLLEELAKTDLKLNNLKNIKDKELIEILFNNKRYNEMLSIDLSILLNKPNKSNNYINMLIQKYKEGYNIDFNNINYFSDNISKASYIIMCLKNGILLQYNKFNLCVSDSNISVILNIIKQDKELGLKIIKELNLEEDVINDISNFFGEKDFKNLSDALSYLPNTNELIEKLEKGEITKITKKDIIFEDFLTPFRGSTILDYALKHNIDVDDFLDLFNKNKNIDIIAILINNGYSYIDTNAYSFLFEDVSKDIKIIDLLMLNNYTDFGSNDMRIIPYAFKYNNFSIIGDAVIENLFVEKDGKLLIEKYLNNEEFVKSLNDKKISSNNLLKLYKIGQKGVLVNASERVLLTKVNGITVLEDLLNSNITPNTYFRTSEFMDILIKCQRYDLMYKAVLKLLLNEPSKDNNYLDVLINSIKNGKETNFEKFNFEIGEDKELIARCYIQMAKNDLLGYLPNLNSDKLLDTGRNKNDLLYYLVLLDKDLTINKILTKGLKDDPKIFAKLKLYGVSLTMDVEYDKFNLSSLYVKVRNQEYLNGVKIGEEKLIEELYQLFINDGISDKELVDALITTYRYNISVNPLIITEIEKLIEIKKAHPEFCYKREKNSSYFNRESVMMCSYVISTLNHETGHALHYYLADNQIPSNYEEVINRIISSESWLKRVSEFSIMVRKMRENVIDLCSKIVEESIANKHIEEQAKEIKEAIEKRKESLRSEYKELGYDEEKIDLILSDSFTIEEFVKCKKEIQKSELKDKIFRYDYDVYMAIGDIIDAISKGKYFESVLKNENNEQIKATNGHGVRYYSEYELRFCEMIADYSQIMKSKNRIEGIKMLRFYVGEELVDLLEEFYNKKILGIENTQNISL